MPEFNNPTTTLSYLEKGDKLMGGSPSEFANILADNVFNRSLTRAQLQALITASSLIVGQKYTITNAVGSTLSLVVKAVGLNVLDEVAVSSTNGQNYIYDIVTDTATQSENEIPFSINTPLNGQGLIYNSTTEQWENKELDFANVLDYGALGDGITNDSAAIVLAIASGKPVFFPSGTYLIATTIAVTSNTTFLGVLGASILQSASSLTSMFAITSTDDVVFNGLSFVGGDTVPTTVVSDTTALALTGMGTNIGININGGKKVNISNCSFEGFSSCGVKYVSSSSDYHYGVKVTNCYFVSNYCGVLNLTSGEYSNFTNNTYSYNQIGIYVDSGNNIIDSCHIDGNNVGVVIGDGTNNGHGVLSNSTINHSVYYGVVCQGLTNGFLITSNQIWYSNIILIDSAGITINGGYFAQAVMRFQGGLAVGLCKITNVCFGANGTIFRNYNAQSSNVLMTGNYYYTGVDASAINNGDNNIWNKSSINATVLGSTLILDATNPIFIDSILLYLSAYSGVSANALSVSIGTNSPNYNNILANTDYSTLLNGTFKYVKIPITSGTINNADIYIKINGVVTGTSVLLGTKITTQYLNLYQ